MSLWCVLDCYCKFHVLLVSLYLYLLKPFYFIFAEIIYCPILMTAFDHMTKPKNVFSRSLFIE